MVNLAVPTTKGNVVVKQKKKRNFLNIRNIKDTHTHTQKKDFLKYLGEFLSLFFVGSDVIFSLIFIFYF
jgi:hypothetical protein